MQKQPLALKSLKLPLGFQSWSNCPARNHCDLKLEVCTYALCLDLVRDKILCIIEKMGIAREAERPSSGTGFVSRGKAQTQNLASLVCLLCSACCEIPANVWTQVFIGFDWNCSVVSAFASFHIGFFFAAIALLRIHTCAMHMEMSLLKADVL